MREYIYPKVPSHYHEVVTDEFLTDTDVVITEKLDGSNCKVTAYDNRYPELYGDDVHKVNPEHGDIVISTKKTVQGLLSDPLSEFDGAFHRLIKHLRKRINGENLLSIHDTHNSPVVLYGEHMIRTTLDYEYSTDPPPAFIGFDVLIMDEFGEQPSNPLKQRFNGFLHIDKAYQVFDSLNLDTARIIDRTNTSTISQTGKELDITVPESEYANTTAEGVVLRSYAQNRRVKYRSKQFRERSSKSWSALEDDCDTGAEMFCAKFVTNPRIQKTIMKAVNDPDIDTVKPETLVEMVVMDAWNEELSSIIRMQTPIHPQEVYDITYTRCETLLDTFRTNAELNDTDINNIWTDFVDSTDINTTVDITQTDKQKIDRVVNTSHKSIEHALINEFADDTDIIGAGVEHAIQQNKQFGNWVIPAVNDTLEQHIWYENLSTLANLPVAFNPQKLTDTLTRTITDTITTHTDFPPRYKQTQLMAHYIAYKVNQTT